MSKKAVLWGAISVFLSFSATNISFAESKIDTANFSASKAGSPSGVVKIVPRVRGDKKRLSDILLETNGKEQHMPLFGIQNNAAPLAPKSEKSDIEIDYEDVKRYS